MTLTLRRQVEELTDVLVPHFLGLWVAQGLGDVDGAAAFGKDNAGRRNATVKQVVLDVDAPIGRSAEDDGGIRAAGRVGRGG